MQDYDLHSIKMIIMNMIIQTQAWSVDMICWK